MWIIIKYSKKNIFFLKNCLINNFGKDINIYNPRILIEQFRGKKLIKKESSLLGDYLFCYNNKFSDRNILNQLKYTRGVKYLLDGFQKSQKEITDFINICKKFENSEGYIVHNFFDTKINHFYKFSSSPFTQKIFKIIELQKNKIKILMGNFTATINKKSCSLLPL